MKSTEDTTYEVKLKDFFYLFYKNGIIDNIKNNKIDLKIKGSIGCVMIYIGLKNNFKFEDILDRFYQAIMKIFVENNLSESDAVDILTDFENFMVDFSIYGKRVNENTISINLESYKSFLMSKFKKEGMNNITLDKLEKTIYDSFNILDEIRKNKKIIL